MKRNNPLTRIDIILSKLLTGYLSMSKPSGGRGHKAPYATTHMRIPEPMKPEVQRLLDCFHGQQVDQSENSLTRLEEAIAIAHNILMQKKSARVSMEKLLTALYHREIKL
jgi:hypothetical protein